MKRTLIFHYTMALIEATIYTINKRSHTKQLGKNELAMTWRKADSFEHIPWGIGDDMAAQYLVFLVITWIPTRPWLIALAPYRYPGIHIAIGDLGCKGVK